jgi:hypothetical protein
MAVVGNGLLKEPEFTALDKRARAFYDRCALKEGKFRPTGDAEMLIALIRSKIVGKHILVSKVVFDWCASRAKEG